jgi:hypothetical protein
MSLWLLITLMGLVKLLVASLMLWLPFRSDSAMIALGDENRSDSEDDEGGSKTLAGPPSDPHPRLPLTHLPRRGPHGSPSSSPARVRTRPRRRVIARGLVKR